MRTCLLICSIFLSLVASNCKSKDTIPGNVLPQKKMQAILWDMMRADQFLSDYVLNKDTSLKKQTESTKLYQQILEFNKVSKEKFQESLSFYKSHPALLRVIMDSIAATPETVKTPEVLTDTLVKKKDSLGAVDTAILIKKIKKLKITDH